MPAVPSLPENAPFTAEQRAWLNGYLAGILADVSGSGPGPAAAPRPQIPLLVAFGSQTGSAGGLAKSISKEAGRRGFQATLKELNAVTAEDLARESRCIIVTSTWGDGDPPDNATAFWSRISTETAARLEHLSFAVLGLGDRNYADFCGASKKLDQRFEQLGGKRVVARGECDVDYEATAKAWIESLWTALEAETSVTTATPAPATAASATDPPKPAVAETASGYSRNRPFESRLQANRRLNRTGSDKDTRHFEFSLEGSGLSYDVGDALGVVPSNCPKLVDEVLSQLRFTGAETVPHPAGGEIPIPIRDALLHHLTVTAVPPPLLKEAARRSANDALLKLLAPEQKVELDRWTFGRDVLDILQACQGAGFTPAEFTASLRKLPPRLYSISSSPKAHPGQVHLTISVVRYEAHGRGRSGVCSGFLADRVVLDEPAVPVFVQTSHGFRLPADGSVPIILIGPGTGIAPFRAFLEERRAMGATGPNWLFFGDQRRSTDFLYEDEIVPLHADGFLTRLDLAFSRDQAAKIYVQDRMRENGAELWQWLERGAHVYVCGDAKRMAKDVDGALHRLIETAGGVTADQAAEYVAGLKSAKRYQRDVY
jgi:sulfite reductase (NADPH) flavoprotein alpha-component